MTSGGARLAVLVWFMLATGALPARAGGRTVTFPSLDGTSLVAELYEPSARQAPGVVLVHMLSRTRADWDALAKRLQDVGLVALAIDLRGHGGSSGSRDNLPDMVQDVRAAVQWLATRQNVRPGAVAIVGASLGANLALLAAADLPTVRVVGLLSPSSDYRGLRLDAAVMKRVKDRSIWMAAGTQDPLSLRTLKDLATEAAGPREQRLEEGSAHGTRLLSLDPETGNTLVDWLRRSLLS